MSSDIIDDPRLIRTSAERRRLIRGATVVDGSGRPPFMADVRIADGRVQGVGRMEQDPSDHVIDGKALILCPGFIDTHAHDDTAALHPDGLRPKLEQGVTTVVTGNCGIGVVPSSPALEARLRADFRAVLGFGADVPFRSFRSYRQQLDDAGPLTNVRALIPHAALRLAAEAENPAGPLRGAPLARASAQLDAALQQGAAGFSTGLVYEPCTFADSTELEAFGRVVARHDKVFAAHIRDEGADLLPSLQEMLAIARATRCKLHISHLKATGRGSSSQMHAALEILDDARRAGDDVTFDVYPYPAGSTALLPALRADENRAVGEPSNVQLASVPGAPELTGRWLWELVEEWGIPLEYVAERILRHSPDTSAIIHMMDPGSVRMAIEHEACFIGSDGLPSPDGRTHPRQYGTFPRVLEQYVLPPGGMQLEYAIRKMTALPAERFAVSDRGSIRIGAVADLVLFSPSRLAEAGTYDHPAQRPLGLSAVFVGGGLSVDEDFSTPVGWGRVL